MDNRDFSEAMRERSNEELYEIVNFAKEEDFLPGAIAAAEKEFRARNLNPTDLSEIAESVKTKRELADRPLSWPSRIAFFVLPTGIITILILVIIATHLGSRGYSRKSSEAWLWMGWGIGFWICLSIFFLVLHLII